MSGFGPINCRKGTLIVPMQISKDFFSYTHIKQLKQYHLHSDAKVIARQCKLLAYIYVFILIF